MQTHSYSLTCMYIGICMPNAPKKNMFTWGLTRWKLTCIKNTKLQQTLKNMFTFKTNAGCISGSCQTGAPNRGTKEHVQNLVYLMYFLQARNWNDYICCLIQVFTILAYHIIMLQYVLLIIICTFTFPTKVGSIMSDNHTLNNPVNWSRFKQISGNNCQLLNVEAQPHWATFKLHHSFIYTYIHQDVVYIYI